VKSLNITFYSYLFCNENTIYDIKYTHHKSGVMSVEDFLPLVEHCGVAAIFHISTAQKATGLFYFSQLQVSLSNKF